MKRIHYFTEDYEVEIEGKTYFVDLEACGYLHSIAGDYMNPPEEHIENSDLFINGVYDEEGKDHKDLHLEVKSYINEDDLLQEYGEEC